jgi:hypothetical protein
MDRLKDMYTVTTVSFNCVNLYFNDMNITFKIQLSFRYFEM